MCDKEHFEELEDRVLKLGEDYSAQAAVPNFATLSDCPRTCR